jgi:hypothetical protein
MRSFVLAALLAAAPACFYNDVSHRSALAPHPTPIVGDGQPMASAAGLELGATNLADLSAPTSGNPADSVEVPGTQVHGGLQVRASGFHPFSIGFLVDHGVTATAHHTNPAGPPVGDGTLIGGGMRGTLAFPIAGSGWSVGVAVQLMVWSVPWVEVLPPCEPCHRTAPLVYHHDDRTPTLAAGVTPSYRTGRWTFFGGLTVQQHPSIAEYNDYEGDGGPEVETGPLNVTVHGGAEVEITDGVQVSAVIAQTVTTDPVRYGPGVGLMLTVPIDRDPR